MDFKGSFGLITYQRKLALLLRDDIPTISSPNTWCLIGGLAEEGEDALETFLREADEEIHAQSENLKTLPLFEVKDTQHGVFVMELNDTEYAKLSLGDEGQRFDFFALEEALRLPLTYTSRSFLEQEIERVRQFVD